MASSNQRLWLRLISLKNNPAKIMRIIIDQIILTPDVEVFTVEVVLKFVCF